MQSILLCSFVGLSEAFATCALQWTRQSCEIFRHTRVSKIPSHHAAMLQEDLELPYSLPSLGYWLRDHAIDPHYTSNRTAVLDPATPDVVSVYQISFLPVSFYPHSSHLTCTPASNSEPIPQNHSHHTTRRTYTIRHTPIPCPLSCASHYVATSVVVPSVAAAFNYEPAKIYPYTPPFLMTFPCVTMPHGCMCAPCTGSTFTPFPLNTPCCPWIVSSTTVTLSVFRYCTWGPP